MSTDKKDEFLDECNKRAMMGNEIKKLKEALIWCSGSNDFQFGGFAREGWEKICEPLLKDN